LTETQSHDVRRFLRACAEHRQVPGDIPPVLFKRAAQALGRLPTTALATPDDLVSELLASVCDGRWSSVNWSTLTDGDFEARLMKSLRDLAVENTDGWSFRKGLREHVAAAMVSGLPPVGDLPGTLFENGRFSRRLIAEAAAWVVAVKPDLEGDASGVTNALLDDAALRIVPLAPANNDRETWEPASSVDASAQIESALDARRLVLDLQRLLTEREMKVLQGRFAGRRLQSLADEFECAVGTVHNAQQKAFEKVSKLARRRGVGLDTMSLALDLCLDTLVT
jgi:hypothetical protein